MLCERGKDGDSAAWSGGNSHFTQSKWVTRVIISIVAATAVVMISPLASVPLSLIGSYDSPLHSDLEVLTIITSIVAVLVMVSVYTVWASVSSPVQ